MPIRRVYKIERLTVPHEDGRTLAYMIRPGTRRAPWHWFKLHEVPQFEGDSAMFECERIKGGWKVLREVASREPAKEG